MLKFSLIKFNKLVFIELISLDVRMVQHLRERERERERENMHKYNCIPDKHISSIYMYEVFWHVACNILNISNRKESVFMDMKNFHINNLHLLQIKMVFKMFLCVSSIAAKGNKYSSYTFTEFPEFF